MSVQRPPSLGLGEDAGAGVPPKKEQVFRGTTATLHQQRRLKQATQFTHKDSADLLPLDQLRRLGTSKDLQPYTVIQRRLMGGSPVKESSGLAQDPRLCGQGAQSPSEETRPPKLDNEDPSTVLNQLLNKHPEDPAEEEEGWRGHVLLVPCKVSTWDVCAKLSTERRENRISKSCLKRLGLQGTNGTEEKMTVDIKLGGATLTCKAAIVVCLQLLQNYNFQHAQTAEGCLGMLGVVALQQLETHCLETLVCINVRTYTYPDDDVAEFCMGLETLISFRTCIDLKHGVLKTPTQEIPFMNQSPTEVTKTVTNPNEQ